MMFRRTVYSVSNVMKISARFCSYPCSPSDTSSNTRLSILDNGVRVATESTSSPLACISLFIEAGSRFETSCNNGITHFVEHMAFQGFNAMSKCELEALLRSTGAKLSANTSREIQIFSARCLAESAPIVVRILANIITDLALPQCEMDSEKIKIQSEIIEVEKDPKAVLFDYLHQTAFQGTPLAKRVIGKMENIQRFDNFFTSSFMCDHYQPYKLGLVGVGNIPHDDMISYAKAAFGHMEGDPCCESEEGPGRFTGSQVIFRDDSMPFAHIAVAFEVPGYNSPDYFPLMAARTMIGSWNKGLGGGQNNASPLARAGSVGKLCESFEAFYIPYRDIGLWGIYYVSNTMDVADMLYNVQKAWMEMCVTIQYSDAERAVNALKLEYAKIFASAIRSCNDLGYQTMYSCGRKGVEDVFYELNNINHLNIIGTMDKWIYDRCPAVAAVGPTEGLPEYNRIRSGQYWLRL